MYVLIFHELQIQSDESASSGLVFDCNPSPHPLFPSMKKKLWWL